MRPHVALWVATSRVFDTRYDIIPQTFSVPPSDSSPGSAPHAAVVCVYGWFASLKRYHPGSLVDVATVELYRYGTLQYSTVPYITSTVVYRTVSI